MGLRHMAAWFRCRTFSNRALFDGREGVSGRFQIGRAYIQLLSAVMDSRRGKVAISPENATAVFE
jgi:hypothetical protein